MVRNAFVIALMVLVGFIVGFRIHAGVPAFLAGLALLLFFMFSLSWLFATIGLMIGNAEAAQAASFPILALPVFASSAFVPTSSMPRWLRGYAENQPVSDVIEAVRALVLGGPTAAKVLVAMAWCVGLVVVFAPIAVARYRRAA